VARWPGEPDEPPDEEESDGSWELDPNDPTHPDYDLSVAAGYASWEPAPTSLFLRRGVVLLLTLALVAALLLVPVCVWRT